MANADRGLDTPTLSRDFVDLGFLIEMCSHDDARAGRNIAESAHGDAVAKSQRAVHHRARKDRVYRNRCIEGLSVDDPKIFSAGIKTLTTLW